MIEFNDIETLPNWLAWKYFKSRLNWPTDKIAYEMNVNERRLIELVNKRASAMNAKEKSAAGETKRILAELEEQYPVPVEPTDKIPDIKTNDVVRLLKEDKTLDEIAHAVRCPIDKFRLWWANNLQLINAQLRKL